MFKTDGGFIDSTSMSCLWLLGSNKFQSMLLLAHLNLIKTNLNPFFFF